MSALAPAVDGGAAAAAPGGALHFGVGLRARYAAPAGRRPAAVAGLPFATLGRRMAPPPLPAPLPAASGLSWRALGAAPLREEPAPAAARPWGGALGQAPAAPPAMDAGMPASDFAPGAPLPELLPSESIEMGHDPGAPFRPLPQAPARPAAGPASPQGARTAEAGPTIDGGGSVEGSGGTSDAGGTAHGGAEGQRVVPVFPGLPERLVPAWAMGNAENSPPAGSNLPRDLSPPPLPAPLRTGAVEAGGMTGDVGGATAGSGLPLLDRAPPPAIGTAGPGDADGPVDRSPAPPAAPSDADETPPLTWPAPRDADGGRGSTRDAAGRPPADGGRAAAAAESRAFADAVGFTPLFWSVPADAGSPPDAAGASASAGADGAGGGEPGPYAPTLLHGITLAAQSLATAVERHETVREARREAQEAARPAAPAPPPAPAVDPTSDEVVRTLMRKMTAMAREERFRAGGLR